MAKMKKLITIVLMFAMLLSMANLTAMAADANGNGAPDEEKAPMVNITASKTFVYDGQPKSYVFQPEDFEVYSIDEQGSRVLQENLHVGELIEPNPNLARLHRGYDFSKKVLKSAPHYSDCSVTMNGP